LLLFFFVALAVALEEEGAALGVCVAAVADADAAGVAALCALLPVEEPKGAFWVNSPVLDCAGW
jgi:hypothetical protein